ncbi:MAG: hypothetical protein CMO55_14905 [Verrucomicrobiales bacterium]|nr:hypothetical protein [Verrucomicrobiales bacterium]
MNEIFVYDKGIYHEADAEEVLPGSKGLNHIGFFFGWVCDSNLESDSVGNEFADEIAAFRRREITGPDLLRVLGGTLASDMLSPIGNEFAKRYYDSGTYFDDYAELFDGEVLSMYGVENNWENYERVKQMIGERFSGMNRGQG